MLCGVTQFTKYSIHQLPQLSNAFLTLSGLRWMLISDLDYILSLFRHREAQIDIEIKIKKIKKINWSTNMIYTAAGDAWWVSQHLRTSTSTCCRSCVLAFITWSIHGQYSTAGYRICRQHEQYRCTCTPTDAATRAISAPCIWRALLSQFPTLSPANSLSETLPIYELCFTCRFKTYYTLLEVGLTVF